MNWHDYFTYNAETGDLIWKWRDESSQSYRNKSKAANKARAGKAAGCRGDNPDGTPKCVVTWIGGKFYKVHRIIWEMHNGPIRCGYVIDHKDGDPWNNRLENLRECTQGENTLNQRLSKKNTSGVKGVHWDKQTGMWRASIKAYGVEMKLGRYPLLEGAVAARVAAEKELHGEFARTAP